MDIFAPFQWFADRLVYDVFGLTHGSHLANSLQFFIYDSLKIVALLLFINYLMAILRQYLPVEKIRTFLTSRQWYGADYLLAALFGAITPFCSCSSIPFFVGFIGAGIPLGVTFSFLIASPLVNEAAVVLLAGFFGWKLTLVYVTAGILIATVGGMILSKVHPKTHINPEILALSSAATGQYDSGSQKFRSDWLVSWWREAYQFTLKLLPYILLGVGVGAIIHGYVPQRFFETTLHSGTWWSVPLATIIAVPLYANAVSVVPIAQALVVKGAAIGTTFAFMMATVGLSLPEALILKKVMSVRLLAAFFGFVTVGIILIGYLVNGLF